MSTDPTLEPGRWRSLTMLLANMDAQIAEVYRGRGADDVRPRFAYPMLRLAYAGPMTVKELATSLDRSHSAMSQTVKAMQGLGLVASTPGQDARTRLVALTDRGKELTPLMDAEWRATEASIAELDDEVPYGLSAVVEDLNRALGAESMSARITRHLEHFLVKDKQ